MMTIIQDGMVEHLQWRGDSLRILDQSRLPEKIIFMETADFRVIVEAIRRLAIRGAPAIGIAAGYALALAAKSIDADEIGVFREELRKCNKEIASARPTAVNLFWALNRLMTTIDKIESVSKAKERIVDEAQRIHQEDIEICLKLSRWGKTLLPDSGGVMTHCNAGGLATGGYGTALGVIHTAFRNGKKFEVFVNETRPLFQGARLTTWELKEAGIPFVLMTDNMAAYTFARGQIDCVIVGADRIAMNGDTANKIGTYNLAVLSKYHKIPFYVAAPVSTIDRNIQSGSEIPIEYRDESEVTLPCGVAITRPGIFEESGGRVINPAFDVTPSHLISAIITEQGVVSPPYQESFERNL